MHLIHVILYIFGAISHPGVVVDLHTRLCVYVLRADNLTVSLQGLQLEELSCRQKLEKSIKKHFNLEFKGLKMTVSDNIGDSETVNFLHFKTHKKHKKPP